MTIWGRQRVSVKSDVNWGHPVIWDSHRISLKPIHRSLCTNPHIWRRTCFFLNHTSGSEFLLRLKQLSKQRFSPISPPLTMFPMLETGEWGVSKMNKQPWLQFASPGELLKLQVPRLQPMLITSESLGVEPGVSIFKACVVQPKLRNSAFKVQSDLGLVLALPLMGSYGPWINSPKLSESQPQFLHL